MKKILLLFILTLFTTANSFSQDFTDLTSYELASEEDYKNAEKKVIECANYLLANPVKEEDSNRINAVQFVLRWMAGTNYTFNIDNKMVELTDGNNALFSLYLTTMSKIVLEHQADNLTDSQIHEQVVDILINYCKDSSNNLKPTKKLKKLMKN